MNVARQFILLFNVNFQIHSWVWWVKGDWAGIIFVLKFSLLSPLGSQNFVLHKNFLYILVPQNLSCAHIKPTSCYLTAHLPVTWSISHIKEVQIRQSQCTKVENDFRISHSLQLLQWFWHQRHSKQQESKYFEKPRVVINLHDHWQKH